jgi:hypothetical protein
MNELDSRGQKPVDAVLGRWSAFAPAHFHLGPSPRHDPPEASGDAREPEDETDERDRSTNRNPTETQPPHVPPLAF